MKKSSPSPFNSTDSVAAVRELAWTGQHAKAIDLASQSLSTPAGAERRTVPTQMDMLDLRAESYIAQGKLDLAAQDAKAMGTLAKTAAHKVQALNRLALVQMRTGDLKAAVNSATAAVGASLAKHLTPALHALALFRLSEAQFRTGQNEAALETAQQASTLFQKLGDLSGTGRTHWVLSSALRNLSRADEAHNVAQTALELCRRAGDQYGIGNALNVLSQAQLDIADTIQYRQQARQAFEIAGYAERQAVVLGNLGLAYLELGLYPHCRRLQNKVVEMTRRMGAKVILTYALANLIEPELILGEIEVARLHVHELERLVPELGDPIQESGLFSARAELAFAAGDLQTAIRHQKSALTIDKEAQTSNEHINLTELGKMHLAAYDPAAALRATTKATDLHRAQDFAKPNSFPSQAIWWRHAQALNANKKIREAREALDRAYDFLLDSIASIRDEGLRRNALNKVELNRELLQYWVNDGAKRKLPKERLFAHLNIESNLREPFKRLADTGLRLNALHTMEAIQSFLVEEATELSGGERVMLILETDGHRQVAGSILPLRSYQSGQGYEKAEDPQAVLSRIEPDLDQARRTRATQLIRPHPQPFSQREKGVVSPSPRGRGVRGEGVSRVIAPLIAQNQVIGYLYVDMDSLYGTFTDVDRDMLGMLANQGAVALDNAGLLEGLEQKVEERTAELNARVDELAILNSVGEAMAKTLDVKTVTRIVGDKVQSIFAAETVTIRLYDSATHLIHRAYDFDRVYQDLTDTSFPLGQGLTSKIIGSGKPLLFATGQEADAAGALNVPQRTGNEIQTEAYMGVPIITGNKVIGVVTVQSYEQNAYNESHVRLLQTLSANMGVAIQNARLFEAEQDRVAELQILNTISQGLVKELDFQAIVDLVGDKLHEIFGSQTMSIRLYDRATDVLSYPYMLDGGRRVYIDSRPLGLGLTQHIIRTRQPLVINGDLQARMADFGSYWLVVDKDRPDTKPDKSFVGMPILAGEEIIGVITLGSKQENVFSDSAVSLLTTLASTLGVALQNARLFDETQRLFKAEQERVAELAIINSIQAGLASKLDFQAIIDLVGDKLREIFDTGDIGICWYDRHTNLMHDLYSYEHGVRAEPQLPVAPKSQAWFKMVETRQAVVMNSIAEQQAMKITIVDGADQQKSMVRTPIFASDQILGFIDIFSHERENAYSESDVRLLQTVGNAMGVALENARLFDETQRLLQITEQRNAELAIINSVQDGLAKELNYQAISELVGQKVREISGSENMSIRLYDPATNMVSYPYVVDGGVLDKVDPAPLGTGLTAQIIKTRQTLVINQDLEKRMADFGSYWIGSTTRENDKSFAGVPILVGDKAIGAIILGSKQENAFSESDVRLLQTLAGSLGVSLENARLFDETQRLLKITEERAAELAIINSVQQGLASKLDMQAIFDLVGDKIQSMFNAQSVIISTFDHEKEVSRLDYAFENGERVFDDELLPFSPMNVHLIATRQTVAINENAVEQALRYGLKTIQGTASAKSLIFVPFGTGTQVNGYFSLQNVEHENAFTDSDMRLLQTLAGSMGIALENARLFNAEQQRAAELAAISTVTQALVAEPDLANLIQIIGGQTREIFKADIAYLALLDPQTELIHFPYQHGEDFTTIKLGEGLTSKIIQSGEPLLINQDVAQRRQQIGATLVGREALSYLGVPIKAGKETIGVMSVQSLTQEGIFNNDSLRLLTTIAANAGAALRTAQLHNETQRRAKEMATLAEIGNDIAATRELEPVLEKIAAHAMNILRVRDIGITLREPDNDLFRTSVALGHNVEELKSLVVTLKIGLMGSILDSGVAEFVNNPTADPRVIHVPGTPEEEDAQQYLMGAPLISRGQTIGGIMVWRERPDVVFTQADLDFLVSVARQTAIAIESARLYLETQRRAKEMSALVEVGRDISSSLEAATVLEGIATHARDLLNSDTSALFLPEGDGKTFRAIAAVGDIADELRNDTIAWGQGILGSIAKNKIGEIVNDANNDSRAVTVAGTEDVPDEHIMAVPLLANDEIKGLMAVWRTGQGREFTDFELEFLDNLSRQAVLAVQNAQHFSEAHELRLAAEQANHAKSAFMANMSHELRTPLNAIIGFTRIVRRKADGVLPEKQTDNLDKVLTSAEHLLNLINTILDIAKIEAGRMDVQAANFSPSQLVDMCVTTATPLLKPGVTLVKDVQLDLPLAHSDQDKLKQVLLNLLSNAAKFTHSGSITVTAAVQGGTGTGEQGSNLVSLALPLPYSPASLLLISVSDTGIGLSEEALSRIFEEFQQADTSTTREYGGTGLGLSISRSLARLLGGDITVSSAVGVGSTFTISVPLRYGEVIRSKPASDSTGPVALTSGKRLILAIDDDPQAIEILQESLQDSGYEIVGTTNAAEGLAKAKALRPDLITLDVIMPNKDGWQVLYELKADPITHNIPVIMLTIVDKKPLGYQLGATDYLVKPFNAETLLATLRHIAPYNGDQHPKRLLVVDDDPHVVDLVQQLVGDNYEIESAVDGVQALDSIRRTQPDALLLDLMMPRLDGFGVMDQLQQDSLDRQLPVIVLTAKDLTAAEAELLSTRAVTVIKKQGLQGPALLQALDNILRRSE